MEIKKSLFILAVCLLLSFPSGLSVLRRRARPGPSKAMKTIDVAQENVLSHHDDDEVLSYRIMTQVVCKQPRKEEGNEGDPKKPRME